MGDRYRFGAETGDLRFGTTWGVDLNSVPDSGDQDEWLFFSRDVDLTEGGFSVEPPLGASSAGVVDTRSAAAFGGASLEPASGPVAGRSVHRDGPSSSAAGAAAAPAPAVGAATPAIAPAEASSSAAGAGVSESPTKERRFKLRHGSVNKVQDLLGETDDAGEFSTAAPSSVQREFLLLKLLKAQQERTEKLQKRLRETQESLEAAQRKERILQSVPLERLLGGKDALARAQRDLEARKRHDDLRRLVDPDSDGAVPDADDDIDANATCASLLRCFRGFQRFWRMHFPLEGDLRSVEAKYGNAIFTYFRYFQWVTLNMFVLLLCATPMLVIHLVYKGSEITVVSGVWPVALNYSGFATAESLLYTVTIAAFLLYQGLACFYKLVSEDRLHRERNMMEGDDGTSYSKHAIRTLWDWSFTGADSVADARLTTGEGFLLLKAEEERAHELKQRTRQQRVALLSRRIIGFVLVALLILGSWTVIIVLTVLQNTIAAYVAVAFGSQIGSFVGPFVVPIGLGVLNYILPMLLSLISQFERWDEPAFAVKLMSGRLYALKILNVWIIMVSYTRLLMPSLTWLPQLVDPVEGQCAEDQTGQALVALVLTDVVLDKLGGVFSLVFKYVVARVRRQTPHIDFPMEENLVGLLSHQIIVWLAFAYYPFLAWLVLPLDLFGFKWDLFILTRFMSKSEPWGAKDLGRFFLVLTLLTFAFAMVGSYFFLVLLSHNCGPHAGTGAATVLVSALEATPGLAQIWAIVTNGWVLWTAVSLLAMTLVLLVTAQRTVLEAVVDRQQRHQTDVSMYNALVRRLRAEIADLRGKNEKPAGAGE